MFGQQTVPQSSNGRVGLRQKYAMKKALKQKQSVATAQPVSTGRKHYIRKHKNVAVGKPSIFQRIKMFIMAKIQRFTQPKMITSSAPVQGHYY